ncbi:hypothetical protein XAP412_520018 [Xanthomonas phaseoli pv. phaseoli]|uniref:Uncharacterized protein n=1 Tax=Xanthomonas campestris pv. phaseoli TaxID=317013 RepID=A0AB38E2R1_XANCH|nr:hypothetical protein XAP6984_570018 [Xanthomonas phaseoli pv. phaseoli]SON87189.1 hypothetical protein XAP412_520018 [Xanthomonas phaseoli pv. phaseoli]SON91105.1 hypothetical protein XAP7430_530018 [Xanthomonas phaseoli pv. phaseoli]
MAIRNASGEPYPHPSPRPALAARAFQGTRTSGASSPAGRGALHAYRVVSRGSDALV